MSKVEHNQVSKLGLEGRFLQFTGNSEGKPKRLLLATAEGEYSVKLAKKLRGSLRQTLVAGDWVQVSGNKKLDQKTGKLKLKALQVQPVSPKYAETFPQPEAQSIQKSAEKGKVMFCQKSPCLKRGAKLVCQALEAALGDRGLEDQVSLKPTGCMNRCKAGPNIVVMPGKNRYSGIHPEEIPALVEQYFSCE